MTTATSTLVVAQTRAQLEAGLDELSAAGGRVAVVMTMGALHDGHRALIRRARELAEHVVVTIFVNPLQFGAGEDLDTYPRTLGADLEACAAEAADLVFTPAPDVVYPDEVRVTVSAGEWSQRLCGRSRPGHFDGVLTVVAKLLHLTRADVAVFGEKDAQQLALIRRMVRDLDFPVEVVGAPTVREADGLAMSSRNAYLSRDERRSALALAASLRAGAAAAAAGPGAVLEAARSVVDSEPGVRLDYLELVDPELLEPLPRTGGRALLAVAAHVGTTRLIDNLSLSVNGAEE